MDNAFFDYISSSAVSLVVSGNIGISPFMTLFVLGIVEIQNPELLHMGKSLEVALASWWSIGILGMLTVGETIGKCIPAIDELIDSAETCIVPIISVVASLATLGIFDSLLPDVDGDGDGGGRTGVSNHDGTIQGGEPLDVLEWLDLDGGDDNEFDGVYRLLQEDVEVSDGNDTMNDFGERFLTVTKIFLVIIGIGVSLLIHMLKMLVRVSSLVCTGGCCQPCVTIIEIMLVVFGILLSIAAPIFAIGACCMVLIGAGYVLYKRCCIKKDDTNTDDTDTDTDTDDDNNNNYDGDVNKKNMKRKKKVTSIIGDEAVADNNDDNNNNRTGDIENQQQDRNNKMKKRNTSITVAPSSLATEVFVAVKVNATAPPSSSDDDDNTTPFAVAEVISTALPPPFAPNHHDYQQQHQQRQGTYSMDKSDTLEATTY